ncbi:PREDICTED: uncharacterized protein LOC109217149 [Nicotiana attenuata]|uniref:uncharacterized protein LOC109217149 n=1 Tax=Nicotiana attenuata TaxID=49451 RepID=UPI0009057B4C|nr:PREDICTED: uncharacterized protein LOC109217149 [Nicotiana attenuata]
MLHRIQSWTTKYLSYAGRAVLVKSVLFAIQTFWAQVFILPKKVQFIETICRRFLWTGSAEPTRKALIAWNGLCLPKTAGGLNFMDIGLWNEAAICKLLWNICTRKEKLWVHWVHTYYIKGQAVWEVNAKNASWAMQQVFQAKKYFDSAGRISKGDVEKIGMQQSRATKVDVYIEASHPQGLATNDRLVKWGINIDPSCPLCNKQNEIVNHLFFECEETCKIWCGLLQWQGIQIMSQNWQTVIAWMVQKAKGRSARAEICRMVLAAAVYYCWQERKWAVFQEK